MKPNNFGLFASVMLFLIFIVLSLVFQSTQYLYIASVCPLLIVPFLPDTRSSQYLKANQAGSSVRLIKLPDQNSSGDAELLVVLFEPGDVDWQRKKLFLNLDELTTANSLQTSAYSASIAVLPFDLQSHPRKKNWVGISLQQVAARTSQLSYTTAEINRIVIRMVDLQQVMPLRNRKSSSSMQGTRMEA